MIRYSLRCDNNHDFDGWFQSAAGFDTLLAAGHVSCATCGSLTVEKLLMTPAVRPARKAASPAQVPTAEQVRGAQARPLSEPQSEAEAALAALRRKVEENSEYVGMSFASEARDIHEGRAPERAIYGEAKPEEALKLLEDGVAVAPLPFMPKRGAH